MIRVKKLRIGEGLAAAVRGEIEQLDLRRVFTCEYDRERHALRLVLERSKAVREYPADASGAERIFGHLRAYARVRGEIRAHTKSAA